MIGNSPNVNDDGITMLRGIAQAVSVLSQRFAGLRALSGTAGQLTLAAAATTVVANVNARTNSVILLTPTNVAAATLVAGADSPYIDPASIVDGVSFTVSTAGGGSAAGTETFFYQILNTV